MGFGALVQHQLLRHQLQSRMMIFRLLSVRQCGNPISSFVPYNHLSSSSCSFIAFLDSISLPNIVHEASSHPGWRGAMADEMQALDDNGTWDLVPFPTGKKAIGCRWVNCSKV